MATATLIDYTPPTERFFLRFAFSLLCLLFISLYAFFYSLCLIVIKKYHEKIMTLYNEIL